ncbi:T9SS type A sorting domain-containing protein [Ferruginibacter yonginensis]|uniref:T9SS type A sorting domain-containing protein n=1 Tax=Ferruginibacter yonginensis TaxID=1310416 RepID=A0ABV8QNU2_9BACT
MKSKILLTTSLMAASFLANAQSANKGFAITGDGNKDFLWMNIREVNLATGQVTNNIFERSKTNYTFTNVTNKTTTNQTAVNNDNPYTNTLYPTSSFVAAAAYDKRTEKLFFIPMRMGELRWMDVNVKNNTPAFYTVALPNYMASAATDEANNVTRMAIGADDNGYAITNDGNHLYKFSTGKNPVVTDLGSLIDDEANKGISIHNKCSSWGGDMIADAFGKLYIIAATRNVFVVDVKTKIATFKGTIAGLPANYTTNGAAVDASGAVVLSSATAFEGYYKMNINDLVATKIEGSDVKYNAADLASGNLLLQKEADQARAASIGKLQPIAGTSGAINSVYPNPVMSNTFNVLLDGSQNGVYTVVVTDLAGRALQSSKINITKGQQSQPINLVSRPAKGTYLVKVVDAKNSVIISDKVVIL